jgi:hypothetical protein
MIQGWNSGASHRRRVVERRDTRLMAIFAAERAA